MYQAMKLFQYSIKPKKEDGTYIKPIITEAVISEESKEIDDYIKINLANNTSVSSNASSNKSSYSEDYNNVPSINYDKQPYREIAPPIPAKNIQVKPQIKPKPKVSNHKISIKKVETKKNNEIQTDEPEDFLRQKDKINKTAKTDEEIYIELRKICNLSDPYLRYEKIKEVGKGASGTVFIALDRDTTDEVAIKVIDLCNQSSKELILNEIRVLKDFNHKNLVNFLEAYLIEATNHLWVIMEYMDGGELNLVFFN